MKSCKLLLAVICASALLGALVESASARSLSTTSQTMRATFASVRFAGVFGSITCHATIEGSMHTRTIAKIVGALIGYVTSASMGACAEGSASILRETLPWHVRYESFTGTLPAISSARFTIVGVSFRIREPLATCLARSSAESPARITLNRNTGSGVVETAELGGTIATSCGANGSFSSDRGPITVLNSTTRYTITLI